MYIGKRCVFRKSLDFKQYKTKVKFLTNSFYCKPTAVFTWIWRNKITSLDVSLRKFGFLKGPVLSTAVLVMLFCFRFDNKYCKDNKKLLLVCCLGLRKAVYRKNSRIRRSSITSLEMNLRCKSFQKFFKSNVLQN